MKKTLLLGISMFAFIALNAQTSEKATTATTAATTAKVVENPNAPEITFKELTHDYGTIEKGGNGNTEFKFTNTGKEPLILSNVKTS